MKLFLLFTGSLTDLDGENELGDGQPLLAVRRRGTPELVFEITFEPIPPPLVCWTARLDGHLDTNVLECATCIVFCCPIGPGIWKHF